MSLKTCLALACLAFCGIGCGSKPPPDPNDPGQVGIMRPEVLQRNLRWASEMVNDRVAKQEITEAEAKKYLAKYADSLVEDIDFKQMKPRQAWQYADVFRTAERWGLAKKALEMAVAHAKETGNEDRRVNDTLRLAQAQANLGERDIAMATARSVFDTRERDKGAILLAVLYEIAPAVRGHGQDVELAKLLEEAIDQHLQTVIDPETEAGRVFLVAKWHHIRKAWEMVIELYREAGNEEEAQKALQRSIDMMQRQGRV